MRRYYENILRPGDDTLANGNFEDVVRFMTKFDMMGPVPDRPTVLRQDLYQFRLDFLSEELVEFMDAHNAGDVAAAADALIDLVYVAMGTAVLMGVPWQECWSAVQRANMSKVRATRADESKRGNELDCVKPPGWTPPNLHAVMAEVVRGLGGG